MLRAEPGAGDAVLRALCAELRASLDAVRVAAELLDRQTLPPEASVCVRTLLENGARLQRAAAQAQELARPEELAMSAEPVPVQSLVDDLQSGWAAAGVPVLAAFDGPRDLCVSGDPVRLRQLFEGVVRHALAASARRGAVELVVTLRAEAGQTRLSGRVSVSGQAAAPAGDTLNLIFCRALARRMGGIVRTAPGWVSFDIALPEAVAVAAAPESEPQRESPGLHVLIVDDNATNRLVAEAFCDMFGCTCDTAADGVEALEALSRRSFDVVLMDIRMPRMDGLQATAAIRALPGPEKATPVIALTANADPDDVRRYMDAGMLGVVEKPIKADRLAEALNRVVEGGGEQAAA